MTASGTGFVFGFLIVVSAMNAFVATRNGMTSGAPLFVAACVAASVFSGLFAMAFVGGCR